MLNPFETAVPLIVVGSLVEIVLAIALWSTGQGRYLLWMGGVLLVVLLGVAVERLVVTEKERVLLLLDNCRVAAKNNDVDGVLACLDPADKADGDYVRAVMGRVKFSDAQIREPKVKIDRNARPMTASVELTAIVQFKDTRGEVPYQYYMQPVLLKLELRDKGWRIVEATDRKGSNLPRP